MREGNNGVGNGATADQFRFVFLIPVEKDLLFVMLDQLHAAAFETEGSELVVGDFKEDVDDGIAETAELKFFHSYKYLQERWNNTA